MEVVWHELRNFLFCTYLSTKGHIRSRNLKPEPMKDPVDFVVTWVDGADPKWKAEKEKYQRAIGIADRHRDNGEERYRDWELFRYWFRAVEKYAPWVRNVYLITEGHIPEWLNLDCPKLKHICHEDYIPKEYLPTFNSNVIELNIHRIEGLSEHFISFNDDTFLAAPCIPEDFFSEGKPNYTAVMIPPENLDNSSFSHSRFSVFGQINKQFRFEIVDIMKEHPELWFHPSYGYHKMYNTAAIKLDSVQGMFFSHLPVAFRKSAFQKAWELFPEVLHDTSTHRFRTAQDVMHELVSLMDILNNDFYPVSMSQHGYACYNPKKEKNMIHEILHSKDRLTLCINDSEEIDYEDYLSLKSFLINEFQQVFPEKSMYEK